MTAKKRFKGVNLISKVFIILTAPLVFILLDIKWFWEGVFDDARKD